MTISAAEILVLPLMHLAVDYRTIRITYVRSVGFLSGEAEFSVLFGCDKASLDN